MTVELAGSHRVKVDGRVEVGPLMADDRGVFVQAKRKMFTRSHPGRYDLFAWSDVTSYTIGAPAPRMVGGSTINSHHTQLTVRTAANVYSWELSRSQAAVASQLGSWLAAVPAG